MLYLLFFYTRYTTACDGLRPSKNSSIYHKGSLRSRTVYKHNAPSRVIN